MPSFSIHIAVCKSYLEKHHDIKNIQDFYIGNIAPDLEDKDKTHYTDPKRTPDNVSDFIKRKVSLYDFLINEQINSDYMKGYFLHLVTDYIFYCTFINKNYLDKVNFAQFHSDLYYSYNLKNNYINQKYQIDYKIFPQKYINKMNEILNECENKTGTDIIPTTRLDKFIEYISKLNLNDYKNKILQNKGNILP